MINEFLQYIQYEKNYSSHTVLCYHTDLLQLCEFMQIAPEDFNPEHVTHNTIRQWTMQLMNSNISARSLCRKLSTLKSFWRFLIKRGHTKSNPTLKIISPKTKKPLPAFFKEKELTNILDELSIADDFETLRDRLILELFYTTGIRMSELQNLTDNSISLQEKQLRVIGKRNKERIIPIGNNLCDDIEKYIDSRNKNTENREPYFFLRSNGKKLSSGILYRIVHSKMSTVSCLHKRSPHVLRHTFATSLLNGGADINAVKELLGHSSLAATQVYTHASFEELHNIYNNAHPRAK